MSCIDWKTLMEADFDAPDLAGLIKAKNGDLAVRQVDDRSILSFRTPAGFAGELMVERKVAGEFAVEMTAKCVGLPGDMSIFMDEPGNGPGFQFGSGYNHANHLWTYGHGLDGEGAHKHTASAGKLIRRGEWHDVRLEVLDGFVLGWVDGELLGIERLGENYRRDKEFQPILYFFDTEALIGRIAVLGAEPRVGKATGAKPRVFVNSIGMEMRRVEAGRFIMGEDLGGHYDERPAREISIGRAFHLSATQVTNRQYEAFDPTHRGKRGVMGLSNGDDDAVVNVAWHDAAQFCEWLGRKEGLTYRLPTEAEWEYACRAGTTAIYSMGDHLPPEFHKCQRQTWRPEPVSTKVRSSPPNPWGFYEMHGNVEEWCNDWYGPYVSGGQSDPVGRVDGEFKVIRGGSHNTSVRHLRSAKRLGALPDDSHWLLGFRVVAGESPCGEPLPVSHVPSPDTTARQERRNWLANHEPSAPYFKGPRTYVRISERSAGPLFSRHNHVPAITYCPNGDLLAIWFSCLTEEGREMTMAMSRLRLGGEEWDDATLFWDPPSRNVTGCALFTDAAGVIHHFNGMGVKDTWADLALIQRRSSDNGVTWSKSEIIAPHGEGNQLVAGVLLTSANQLFLCCDAGVNTVEGRKEYGTALHVSDDGGRTWCRHSQELSDEMLASLFESREGPMIAGFHGALAELSDGRLMALGRKLTMDGQMPRSVSSDGGKSWRYSTSGLQPHGGGQRVVLKRLKEGGLFHAGFANEPITVIDEAGVERRVQGLFAALSYDDGETWPVKRLVTDDQPDRAVDGGAHTKLFTLGPETAEPKGYLACVQTPDNVIHLISSKNHYAFNKKWIETPMPAKKLKG